MIERSREWTEADLLQLIQIPVLESIELDYKRAAALASQDGPRREIAKDVSAFANSAGGVIVYGMAEDGQRPTQIDPVNPQPFNKEWLENVITGNVQPRIDGLHINPVQLTGANAGRVVYVVTVPQSLTAHQAPDNKYYKRFNFQSVPMEHYEVQDTMNRAKTPIIDVLINRRVESETRDIHRYSLLLTLDNKGTKAAHHIKLVLWFPANLQPRIQGYASETTKRTRGLSGEPYEARRYTVRLSDQVLFPLDAIGLENAGFSIYFEVDQARFEFLMQHAPTIEWIVFADDMVPRSGFRQLQDFVTF